MCSNVWEPLPRILFLVAFKHAQDTLIFPQISFSHMPSTSFNIFIVVLSYLSLIFLYFPSPLPIYYPVHCDFSWISTIPFFDQGILLNRMFIDFSRAFGVVDNSFLNFSLSLLSTQAILWGWFSSSTHSQSLLDFLLRPSLKCWCSLSLHLRLPSELPSLAGKSEVRGEVF